MDCSSPGTSAGAWAAFDLHWWVILGAVAPLPCAESPAQQPLARMPAAHAPCYHPTARAGVAPPPRPALPAATTPHSPCRALLVWWHHVMPHHPQESDLEQQQQQHWDLEQQQQQWDLGHVQQQKWCAIATVLKQRATPAAPGRGPPARRRHSTACVGAFHSRMTASAIGE
jgi:hypothetical protein